ncbi:hypothetical protein [Burkholderia perseverans]|uniref:hypothetical protein n=1 Tax=Burkholderia perseverans TaxID=2615214 RepID=UPI001FEF9F56|nr:hypothetical protein [Burkholderia perseverans]
MLQFLTEAVEKVREALTTNGEHRAPLADALKVAHDTIAALEARLSAVEQTIEAGFAEAGAVAAVVDPMLGAGGGAPAAPVQVETKPAA